ncbi:FtsX-like permease family protein [Actinoplanes friuliensis]|uniref:Putative permease n=1 Tax=Actinoplanes friuliensis DSM 7358 TaxID=1246995 RepID=U5W6I2_9ACTN|nr:FtsX-like permease family protein [Actinoplanes friuliensis]AGZ44759.1 putative permease [Actinoplanes friuliensis DSM 7358]
MISLVLAMMWSRRGQAVTLVLLAMVSVAAAVAAPAYVEAADRAVAAGQVATALPRERSLVVSKLEDARKTEEGATLSFSNLGPAIVAFPGFTNVYAAEYATLGIEPDPKLRSRFVYRQDVCPHLTMVTGRCLIGEGEVVIGEATAKRRSLAAGDRIELTFAKFSDDPRTPQFIPSGEPRRVTVAGVYRVPRPDEIYWGTHGYFAADPGPRPGEPVFTDFETLNLMDHGATTLSIDSAARPGALDVDKLDDVQAALDGVRKVTIDIGAGVQTDTGIPDLLARIDSGRAAARTIVPVIAVPLVLLSCFVIFLAVGYGADGRRPELAVVALRGTRWWERWWLATGESLLAILLGSLLGCLAGQLLVNLIAAAVFPGSGSAAAWSSLQYAPIAAVAAVLAALLALRRQLLSPVAVLLRRLPTAGRRPPVLDLVAGLLAIVTGVQLQLSGDPTGAGLFAPALILFALALIVARALLPIVTRAAVRWLRRGHLGVALAGLQLSRRTGARTLFAMLVASVAVAAYAASAADVAARDRTVQADLGTGAARILTVADTTPQQLITAVRAADRDGTFAMAVARTPGSGTNELPGLAVDATRLAAVAAWAPGQEPAAEVGKALHPDAPAPVVIRGRDVDVEVTTTGLSDTAPLRLSVTVTSVTGLGSSVVALGQLQPGPYRYGLRVPVCAQRCRVDGLQITTIDGTNSIRGSMTVTSIGSINPVAGAVSATELADPARWRMTEHGKLSAAPDGLRVDLDAPNGLGDGAWIQPVDTPYPLPVAATGGADPESVTGLDGEVLPVTRIAQLDAVPRLGVRAVLSDLEYVDRAATAATRATQPEVWLAPDAPADAVDRLAAQGLVITGDTRASDINDQLREQGPALALWFYVLAGVLSTLLAAGALILAATVDRSRRIEDLSALRAQGLSKQAAGRATLWTYPILALFAVVTGVGIALAGWGITGWTLPLAGLDPPPLPFPGWPRPLVLAGVALLMLVVLAGVALLTGRDLRRRVRAAGVNGGEGR